MVPGDEGWPRQSESCGGRRRKESQKVTETGKEGESPRGLGVGLEKGKRGGEGGNEELSWGWGRKSEQEPQLEVESAGPVLTHPALRAREAQVGSIGYE